MPVEIEMSAAKLLGRTPNRPGGGPGGDGEDTGEDTGTGNGNGGGTTTDTGTTTTSSGSSSSSSSSAPAEPQDPYAAWYEKQGAIDKKRVSVFDGIYQQLWGEPAPLAVLQAAVNQGMNRWEFEEAQKKNPAWWKTEAAEDAAHPMDLFLEQLGLVPKKHRKKKGGGDNGPPDPDIEGGPGPDIGPRNKRKKVRHPDYIGPPEVGPGQEGGKDIGPRGE
jgi:hypothetical protein